MSHLDSTDPPTLAEWENHAREWATMSPAEREGVLSPPQIPRDILAEMKREEVASEWMEPLEIAKWEMRDVRRWAESTDFTDRRPDHVARVRQIVAEVAEASAVLQSALPTG